MKLHRGRKRLGLRPVQVLVSEQDIDYLLAKDYELTRTDLPRGAALRSDRTGQRRASPPFAA